MKEFEQLINRAIVGTSLNNPDWDMGKQLECAIYRYIEQFSKEDRGSVKKFCKHFSLHLNSDQTPLREPVLNYANRNNYDVALGFLDLMFNYGFKKLKDPNLSNEQGKQIMGYIYNFQYVLSRATFDKDSYRYALGNLSPLNSVKNVIYDNPQILKALVSKSILKIKNDGAFLSKVAEMYFDDVRKKAVFAVDSIQDIEVFDSANEVLTNVGEIKIEDSYSGSLLDGKITVASDRGYIDRPERHQQDAVLTVAKSDDCFLCVVADGAGGSKKGEYASMSIIKKLATWYDSITLDQLQMLDKEKIANLIDRQLIDVNNEIYEKYNGESYSTVALALCIGDKTIIANIGDSTIYAHDDKKDDLIQVTDLDSYSAGLSYEEARHNPYNNKITMCIGHKYIDSYGQFAHYKTFNNEGEKLIMTSDGITDLISEDRFKEYFKEDVTAAKIVNDAVYRPDIVPGLKSADNASAIVIQLPNNYQRNYNGSGRRM